MMTLNSQKDMLANRDWVCPTDRHLTLRSKLHTGWSVRASQLENPNRTLLTHDELNHIQDVVAKLESIDATEQKRIGELVFRLNKMRSISVGDGSSKCVLCAENFGKFGSGSPIICMDCRKNVCAKCCVNYATSPSHMSVQSQLEKKHYLCKICSESRELWKRSGAWFFHSLPSYVLPESVSQNIRVKTPVKKFVMLNETRNVNASSNAQLVNRTYSYCGRHRSSSSDSSDDDNSENSIKSNKKAYKSKYRINDKENRRSPLTYNSPVLAKKGLVDDFDSDTSEGSIGFKDSGNENVKMWNLHSGGKSQSTSSLNSLTSRLFGSTFNLNQDGLGSIEFTAHYDASKYALHVHILNAKNLKSMDINGTSDPYVKLHILPGSKKSTKMRTKTKWNTLNPVFDEALTYWGISEADMERKKLRLTVLDEDRFGHNEFIGEVCIPLKKIHSEVQTFSHPLTKHQVSKEDEKDKNERGKVLLSLCHLQRSNALLVTINRCSSLVYHGRSGNVEPQVKCALRLFEGKGDFAVMQKTSRKKSSKTSNPQFNECLRLELCEQSKELASYQLDVTFWNKDSFGREYLIGAITFGINSKGEKLRHWFNCIKSPGDTLEMWHLLYLPDDRASLVSTMKHKKKTNLAKFVK